jgi:hypothetical protein
MSKENLQNFPAKNEEIDSIQEPNLVMKNFN